MEDDVRSEYIAIKALENGVTLIGLTRGRETRAQPYGEAGQGRGHAGPVY